MNLNIKFIKTLRYLLYNEISYGVFRRLNIDLRLIDVKNINMILIPTFPYEPENKDFFESSHGLNKIRSYTDKYFRNMKKTSYLEKISYLLMQVVSPNYNVNIDMINTIYNSFVPALDNVKKNIRLNYPSNRDNNKLV